MECSQFLISSEYLLMSAARRASGNTCFNSSRSLTARSLDFSASLSKTTAWKRMKILTYRQRQKCLPETVVSGEIRFMRTLATVLAWLCVN